MRQILTIRSMLRRQEPKLVRTGVGQEFKQTLHRTTLNQKPRVTKVRSLHELQNGQFRESPPIQQRRKAHVRKRSSMIALTRALASTGRSSALRYATCVNQHVSLSSELGLFSRCTKVIEYRS